MCDDIEPPTPISKPRGRRSGAGDRRGLRAGHHVDVPGADPINSTTEAHDRLHDLSRFPTARARRARSTLAGVAPDDTYTHGHLTRVAPVARSGARSRTPPRYLLPHLSPGLGRSSTSAADRARSRPTSPAAGGAGPGRGGSSRSDEVLEQDRRVGRRRWPALRGGWRACARPPRRQLRRGARPPGPPAPVRPRRRPPGDAPGVQAGRAGCRHATPTTPAFAWRQAGRSPRPLAGHVPGRGPRQRRRAGRRAPPVGVGARRRVPRRGGGCVQVVLLDAQETTWWGGTWAERMRASSVGRAGGRRRSLLPGGPRCDGRRLHGLGVAPRRRGSPCCTARSWHAPG